MGKMEFAFFFMGGLTSSCGKLSPHAPPVLAIECLRLLDNVGHDICTEAVFPQNKLFLLVMITSSLQSVNKKLPQLFSLTLLIEEITCSGLQPEN